MAYEAENGKLRLYPETEQMFSMLPMLMPPNPMVEKGVGSYDITPENAAYHYWLEVKPCEKINDNIGFLTITPSPLPDSRRPKISLMGKPEPRVVDSPICIAIGPRNPIHVLTEVLDGEGELFGAVAHLPENIVASVGSQWVQRLER